ncbi:putative alcohol dehydrogenase [Emiliania huxleyi CCMP1516]|uniref:Aldehyde dehydrogenase domain-containing protein n=3 Tax=Emiliania huxleyi TaxID=2903 RepID=A0A0D3IGB1_EMIH1|nr:putative alcohol dehydrogenase [Emiliania huxleyi CCMP1516]EOD10296.1 putative alcohol dehydrogenase [Emiliania huxleyi CCMP1516]|mmetsp:Transcript_49631/g.159773  ORF Transcript_49631/g.159773 Transcript_49631/m.159773 type:complete len:402 (+) Transcript_49631:394-1599(+)|eukprot:XP_005762725.1 putative alcohol dehydrogenase [Emiliania huxleyi CCMP1516]
MGKILSEATEEVEGAADKDEFVRHVRAANECQLIGGSSILVRDAHGVVAVCAPWNFPVDEILLLAIPALAAGNAVVVKPSEVAPLSGQAAVEALQAGLPSGLVGLVQGDGAVGQRLVESPLVDMVAMTGSSATGKRIMSACAGGLKRLVLELGGKDPFIVFEDADLDLAAKDAVAFSLMNCGQVCCAVERVYVAEAVQAAFEERVVALARGYVAGNGLDSGSKIGPMVSASQRKVVSSHVESAIAEGATCLLGGPAEAERLAGALPHGHFYPATVLSGVPQGARITAEETFGPVVAITPFDGEEATAVALANDSEYGLSACVYTGSAAKGARVAARIKTGQVGINNWPLINAAAQCPWAGQKGSGFGYHSGEDGWRQFSSPKSLVYATAEEAEAVFRELVK